MTESRPPQRTAGGAAHPEPGGRSADQDTTALPRLNTDGNWSIPSVSGGSGTTGSAGPAHHEPSAEHGSARSGPDANSSEDGNGRRGLGAKLSEAAASVAAGAAAAANSTREAVTGAGRGSTGSTGAAGAPTQAVPLSSVPASVPAAGPRRGESGYGADYAAAGYAPSGYAPSDHVPASPTPAGPVAAGQPRATKATRGRGGNRQPRKARLTLSHINVYSVFKFSCVLAIALFFVWLIAIGVLYGVLDVAGVLDKVNSAVGKISGSDNPKNVVTGSVVFGSAIIIGAVYIVLFIAISTIGSMIYNLCADLVGGVEVTLSERE